MASGWGITGNKGRCYDFWIDFSDCMSRCREPKDCALLREDYLECLHHSKEFQRRNRVYKEEQRKLRAAKGEAKEGRPSSPSQMVWRRTVNVVFILPSTEKGGASTDVRDVWKGL
ncbi:NADH dehydrogenase [ubiquinone] iron-sulfur protein 5-B, partial [Cucurbita argyrosperma subsp. sororia]